MSVVSWVVALSTIFPPFPPSPPNGPPLGIYFSRLHETAPSPHFPALQVSITSSINIVDILDIRLQIFRTKGKNQIAGAYRKIRKMQNKSKKNLQNLKFSYYALIRGSIPSRICSLKSIIYRIWQKVKQHSKQENQKVVFRDTSMQ